MLACSVTIELRTTNNDIMVDDCVFSAIVVNVHIIVCLMRMSNMCTFVVLCLYDAL